MPRITPPTTPAPAHRTAAEDDSFTRRGFFAHHGLWAPGVRLFRKLSFSAKAGLISLTLLVPLLLLCTAYWHNSQQAMELARLERAGVTALRVVEPWIIEVQKQRRLTLAGQVPRPDAAALQAKLEAVRRAVADSGFDLSKEVSAAERLHAAVAALDNNAPTPATADVLQAYVDGAVALRAALLDRSDLTLDPDQDSYYLMALATDVTSEVIESVSRSRALAGRLSRVDAASAAELRELFGVWYLGQARLGQIDNAARRAVEANAALASRIPAARATEATAAYLAAAHRAWFEADFDARLSSLDALGQASVDALRDLTAKSTVALDELLQARIERVTRARQLMLAVTLLSVALAAYLFYSFYLVMSGGLKEVGRHLRAMTEGDLTSSPRPWGRDEAATLMLLLADMQGSLRRMVAEVRQAADGIVQASSEIAEGSNDLSARTEKTASNLQQSASAMEEIGATVRQTSANTQEATQMASNNALLAQEGGRVIEKMVANMDGIQASSTRIGDIIGTIDSIAFQTNILALNAAVEAARAGEHGRGFAVVAAEVRGLAQRSATAAKEIKTLIGRSVEQVQAGTGIVQEAGSSMTDIVTSAQRINQLLAEIATGSDQQSQGIEQVGGGVQELDRATQQNAAMVEETAAAAAALRAQALGLAAQVSRFKLPPAASGR